MENITAKDVYLFAEYCLKVQKDNAEYLKSTLIDPKLIKNERKKIKLELKRIEEKQDFLENTKSIVLALYERQKQTLEITDDDKKRFEETYINE